ncbi:hypothetical protein P3T76_009124 [Phytophthora citrophthora]|uniref:Uncharacterized protein n=1 Tax=Phytophthora citrophthora TaxID=4793 RepID=A0AAD9GIF8_9STRA|nr:hypothetical protein P3T76_009124 [Phytophthora citrophthora]
MDEGSTGTPHLSVTRTDCAHLSDPEWGALQRRSRIIGEAAVATVLRTLSPTELHGVALGYCREVGATFTAVQGRTVNMGVRLLK